MYYSPFPAGIYFLFGVFLIIIISKHSRHELSYESYGSFVFIQGSLKSLRLRLHKFLE